MFGAAAIGHLTRLPRRADCGAYWEARFSVHVSLQTSSNPLSWRAVGQLGAGHARPDQGLEAEVLGHRKVPAEGREWFEISVILSLPA